MYNANIESGRTAYKNKYVRTTVDNNLDKFSQFEYSLIVDKKST